MPRTKPSSPTSPARKPSTPRAPPKRAPPSAGPRPARRVPPPGASGGPVFAGVPRPEVEPVARLYEEVSALVKPAPVVAVSANTKGLDEDAARSFIDRVAATTGLPT